jgi:hypothetical protein
MAKTPKPEPPIKRNPMAMVVTKIPQQVLPNKKKKQKQKHKLDHSSDWACSILA